MYCVAGLITIICCFASTNCFYFYCKYFCILGSSSCSDLILRDIVYDSKELKLDLQWLYLPAWTDSNYTHFNITVTSCIKGDMALQVLKIPLNYSAISLDNITETTKIAISICSMTPLYDRCTNKCNVSSVFVNSFLGTDNAIKYTLQINETLFLASSIDYYEDISRALLINGKFYMVNASNTSQPIIYGTDALEYSIVQMVYTICVIGQNAFEEFGRNLTIQEMFIGQSICGNSCTQQRGQKYNIDIVAIPQSITAVCSGASALIEPSSTEIKTQSNIISVSHLMTKGIITILSTSPSIMPLYSAIG